MAFPIDKLNKSEDYAIGKFEKSYGAVGHNLRSPQTVKESGKNAMINNSEIVHHNNLLIGGESAFNMMGDE